MRVTFVLPPLTFSGGARVVSIYAKALSRNGHEVTLVSTPHPPKTFTAKLKSFLKTRIWPHDISQPSHLNNQGLNYRVIDEARPITDNDVPDADVVIATWWETAEWVNKLSAKKGEKFYFVQGYEIFDYLPIDRCKATYRMPLHKIVVAKWLQDIMRNEYEDFDVDLVHNSVDKTQFYAQERNKQPRPTVGFLFAHAKTKGVDVTLQAIAEIKKRIPNLRIVSFGAKLPHGTPYWDSSIEFFHTPAQDKIKDIYAQCDVWLTASRSEGFNLPAMEAMTCRTPIVASDTGWPSEAIENYRNGMLVPIDDIDALIEGAFWVLGLDNQQWKEVSEAAYQTVADSSWEKSAALFEQALLKRIRHKSAINSFPDEANK